MDVRLELDCDQPASRCLPAGMDGTKAPLAEDVVRPESEAANADLEREGVPLGSFVTSPVGGAGSAAATHMGQRRTASLGQWTLGATPGKGERLGRDERSSVRWGPRSAR
jgi:hypothetical protein